MTTLDRCLESLAFCHVQDDLLWASARIVAQQDIDEFVTEAGPDLASQLEALHRLMEGFEARFAGQTDPVLIRSTMRRHIRRIEFDLRREGDQRRQFHDPAELTESPATAPEVHAHSEDVATPQDGEAEVVEAEAVAHAEHAQDGRNG